MNFYRMDEQKLPFFLYSSTVSQQINLENSGIPVYKPRMTTNLPLGFKPLLADYFPHVLSRLKVLPC